MASSSPPNSRSSRSGPRGWRSWPGGDPRRRDGRCGWSGGSTSTCRRRSLASRSPRWRWAVSAPMHAFRVVFYPVIWALNGLANATLRLVGLGPAQESGAVHTEDELRLIVREMRTHRPGTGGPLEVVERTLRLRQRAARDL